MTILSGSGQWDRPSVAFLSPIISAFPSSIWERPCGQNFIFAARPPTSLLPSVSSVDGLSAGGSGSPARRHPRLGNRISLPRAFPNGVWERECAGWRAGSPAGQHPSENFRVAGIRLVVLYARCGASCKRFGVPLIQSGASCKQFEKSAPKRGSELTIDTIQPLRLESRRATRFPEVTPDRRRGDDEGVAGRLSARNPGDFPQSFLFSPGSSRRISRDLRHLPPWLRGAWAGGVRRDDGRVLNPHLAEESPLAGGMAGLAARPGVSCGVTCAGVAALAAALRRGR